MDIYTNTGTKWTALAIGVAALVMSPFDGDGISIGCSWLARLSYPIFHVNILHALCNAWALITLVFYYDLHWKKIALAFAIAVSIPACFLSATPVVGMSGVCFALMGMTFFVVRRKVMFMSWAAAFLVAGFLLPGVAAMVHVYCYAVGLAVGTLTSPLLWQKEK
jgi:membrane associated rhomboid family serine protease